MVTYHKPKNLKDLVIPNKMKPCKERDLRDSTYAEKQTENVLGVAVKDRVKDGVSLVTGYMLNTMFNLAGPDI